MLKFRIVRISSTEQLGDYEADSSEHALTIMAHGSGYDSLKELCNELDIDSSDFRVFKVDEVRQAGFTCPMCGSHYFGTSMHPPGTNTGHCKENHYSGNGCRFVWDRSDENEERAVMYEPTRDEWTASYEARRQSGEAY
jgi:hypothetical protein